MDQYSKIAHEIHKAVQERHGLETASEQEPDITTSHGQAPDKEALDTHTHTHTHTYTLANDAMLHNTGHEEDDMGHMQSHMELTLRDTAERQ